MEWGVFLPFAAIFLMFTGMTYYITKLNNWKALPEYSANALCTQCESANLTEQPLWGKGSIELVYVCQDCHSKVYKNTLPDHDD